MAYHDVFFTVDLFFDSVHQCSLLFESSAMHHARCCHMLDAVMSTSHVLLT